jgi:hypothetical protein
MRFQADQSPYPRMDCLLDILGLIDKSLGIMNLHNRHPDGNYRFDDLMDSGYDPLGDCLNTGECSPYCQALGIHFDVSSCHCFGFYNFFLGLLWSRLSFFTDESDGFSR